MTNKQYEFVKRVASGVPQVDAYEEVFGCSRSHAQRHAAAMLRKAEVAEALDKFREADKAEARELRMEVLSVLLETMRDEGASAAARLRACQQVAELVGMSKQVVEVSADEVFRAAVIGGCKEGLVRGNF